MGLRTPRSPAAHTFINVLQPLLLRLYEGHSRQKLGMQMLESDSRACLHTITSQLLGLGQALELPVFLLPRL